MGVISFRVPPLVVGVVPPGSLDTPGPGSLETSRSLETPGQAAVSMRAAVWTWAKTLVAFSYKTQTLTPCPGGAPE